MKLQSTSFILAEKVYDVRYQTLNFLEDDHIKAHKEGRASVSYHEVFYPVFREAWQAYREACIDYDREWKKECQK